MTKYLFALSIFSLSTILSAQNGGKSTFDFLNLSTSAHTTALGGIQPAFAGNDPARAVANPALFNEQLHGQLSLHTFAYYAGITTGYVGYAHHFDSLATFGAGIQYITYGTMSETDEYGQTIGTFNGGEYAFYLSGAKAWGKFSVGTNLKFIVSNLAEYGASGIAADLGLAYNDTAARFQIGLTVKNIGTQLSTYNGTKESLPFDIQFGISKRLKYLPFRFYFTANRLNKWDIRYNDPSFQPTNAFNTNEEDTLPKSHFADILFRHFVLGCELHLGKALSFQVGYNFLRKQELSLVDKRSLAGFSFGVGIHVKRVTVNYAMATLHQASATHHFGVNVRFGKPARVKQEVNDVEQK